MSFTPIATASAPATGSGGGTTSPIDTTGADLLVVAVLGNTSAAPTDSKSNTWVGLTTYAGSSAGVTIWYCRGGTAGSGHTFSSPGGYAGLWAGAFAGSKSSGVFDLGSDVGTGTSGVATLSPGSVTPSAPGAIIISACAWEFFASFVSVDSGFTASGFDGVGGTTYGGAGGYLIQSSASPVNPTWTRGDASGGICSSIAVFLAESGPPPANNSGFFALMG